MQVPHPEPVTPELISDIDSAAHSLVVVWGRSAERARPKVSASQLRALLVVQRHATISLSALADEIGAIPSVASRLCDRLQAAGWLVRGAGEADRREIALQLSPDGERLLRDLRQERRTDLHSVLAEMSPRHRAELMAGLEAFSVAADRIEQQTESA